MPTNASFFAALMVAAFISPAAAQDIRGLEVCTAEKQMERRTGCLQANVEFLHQALIKQARENSGKIDTASREVAAAKMELATAKAEIAVLKATLAKLEGDVAQLKAKAEPAKK